MAARSSRSGRTSAAGARAAGAAEAGRGPLPRLWAPWRMAYIRGAAEPTGCLFCRVRGPRDRANLVLARRPNGLPLNRYPYSPAT
jgi:hypothetical protein